MKNKTLWLFIAFGVVAIAYWLMPKKTEEATASAAKPAAGMRTAAVKVYVVSPQPLEEQLQTKGSLLPNEEVAIASEINGKLQDIHFKEGDRVSKGQLLLSINDSELQAQIKKSMVESAFLEQKLEREKKLAERGGVSQEQVEATTKDLDAKRAEQELLQAQIAKTKIVAPFSGTIGLRQVSDGSFLTAGRTVAMLVSTNPLKLECAVPEKYMGRIKNGTVLYYSVEGIGQDFKAFVYAIDPKVDPTTRTIRIRATAPNANPNLLPGAFANVKIVFDRVENALLVPTEAIIPEMAQQKVFVVSAGKATSRAVQTGLRGADNIQITSGLQAGDSVITSGILQLQEGMPVKVSMP